MKGASFLTQRTLSAKDSKNLEIRKLRRKNIGDALYTKPSNSKDPSRALTQRENSFLHKQKTSEPQINIFKSPLASKPANRSSEKLSTTNPSHLYKNFSNTGHRRTKTLTLADQKKLNYGPQDQPQVNNNSSYLNQKKPLEKSSKENNFNLDLKGISNSAMTKKSASFSGAGGISDRGPKGDTANKIKQALTTKFTNTLGKKRSLQPDRPIGANQGERFSNQQGATFQDNNMRQSYHNFKKYQAQNNNNNNSNASGSHNFDKKNSLGGTASLKENPLVSSLAPKRQNYIFADMSRGGFNTIVNDKNSQSDNKLAAQTSRDTSAGLNRFNNESGTINSSRTDRKLVNHTKSHTEYDLSGVRNSNRQLRESIQNQRSTSPIANPPLKKADDKFQRPSGAATDRPSLRKPSKSKLPSAANFENPKHTPDTSPTPNRPQIFNSSAYKQLSKNLAFTKDPNLPKFEETKTIIKDFGRICAFGVNTHKGCVRNFNEDRVSIL
jgi:hypothetical protein